MWFLTVYPIIFLPLTSSMQLFSGMKMAPHLRLTEPKAVLFRVCFHFFKGKLVWEQEHKWKCNQSQLWGNNGKTMHSVQHPDCPKRSSIPRCANAVQWNTWVENSYATPWEQCIDVCAFELPLRKLPDLRYAHVFVEMLQHIDHSLQQVGHLTVLPLSGHGSATRGTKMLWFQKIWNSF